MKFSLSIFTVLLLAAAAFSFTAPGYKITGTITGLPDSTWLYLRTANPDVDIDSCRIINEKFSMTGRITEKARKMYLHTARYTNYVGFWLENAPINVNLKAGEFKKGIITGSATENEDKSHNLTLAPVNIKTDSLTAALSHTKDTAARKKLIAEMKELEEQAKQIDIDYVKTHPNSIIAVNILNIYSPVWGRQTSKTLYHGLTAAMKATSFGKDINKFIILNKDIKIGDKFADFKQLNTLGKPVKLSNIKGKYILLDFWASWCGPCLAENPNLVKTYARFKDEGFTILGVSLDDNKGRWIKAIADGKLTWEQVSDLKGDKNEAALIYGITGIPDNFLIDDKGTIIARNLRGNKLDEKLSQLLP